MATRRSMVPMAYPVGQEYAYRRILLSLNAEMKKLLRKHMVPRVSAMAEEATAVDLPTGAVRQDEGWQDELKTIIDKITRDMRVPVSKTILKAAKEIGPGVNKYNKEQWRKLIRSQYGVNPTAEDPKRFDPLMKNWSINNALLIKDIPFKTMRQIAQSTEAALRVGTNLKDLTKEVYGIMSERMEVSDSRARLIARDQVSKLNGNLTEERQIDMGITGYIWRTVGDERVRDTHDENDGQEFTWDQPPETGHPGEDVNCRCWAEPILPERLEFEASLRGYELDEAA